MNLSEIFSTLTASDIEAFATNGQEENLQLDFKLVSKSDLSSKDDKKNLAKALSAFSNSSGGLVIWGVDARQGDDDIDRAVATKPLDDPARFVTRLNTVTGEYVSPIVEGVNHRAILLDDKQGFVVTLIPESDSGPHMAKGGEDRYYKRSGDSFYRMEHFDIEDMFGRRKKPRLGLFHIILPSGSIGGGGQTAYQGKLVVGIANSGRGIAKAPYMRLKMNNPYRVDPYGLTGNRQEGLPRLFHSGPQDEARYGGATTTVIHPGVVLEVAAIGLEVHVSHDKKIQSPQPLKLSYDISAEGFPLSGGEVFLTADSIASTVLPTELYPSKEQRERIV